MNGIRRRANAWKNPRVVRNRAARRVAESLLLGKGLGRRAAAAGALGTFVIELPSASSMATLALAGFDFVVLDMEHSSIDCSTLEPLILAAQGAGLAALVRTWGDDDGLIGKVLDMGAHGVMIPHVDSVERASAIVNQTRFPPQGQRGFSPLTKFDALGAPLRALDQATFVVVQIEGREALAAVGEIAAVPGINAVFIGPYDLALSLGVAPGSARVMAAAERMAKAVPESVALGIYVDDPASCGAWAARGFALQCVSFDGRMLANGARLVVDEARRSMSARRGRKK
jgi:2-keto-3-deoxy-L-rhamnonate aldolase RhmA